MMKISDLSNVRIFRTIKDLWQRLRPQKIVHTAELVIRTKIISDRDEEDLPVDGIANAVSIHDMLDYLPGYFDDLKALRKYDPATYSIMAKLGGVVTPENSGFRCDTLMPKVLDNPPLMRCIFFKKSDQYDKVKDTYSASIIYMMRLKGGMSYVAREGHYCHLPVGICYRVVVVYNHNLGSFAESFFVHYDANHKMSVVKENKLVPQVIRYNSNKGHKDYRGNASVFHRKTITPFFLTEMVAERKRLGMEVQTTDQIATTLCNICLSAKRPSEAILVRAHKSDMTASWTIDRRDGKRFFAKRVTGSAADGKRKRILHYVDNSVRDTDGRTSYVREHYRGERSFSWMGYGIEVSGLGFHHQDFYDASIETFEFDGQDAPRGFVSIEKSVNLIRQYYSTPYSLPKPQKSRRKKAA
jgi:hypothetical protein